MGFKEDILVLAYTGQTEYSFTLQTGGLTAVNQSGTWVLVDGDNTVRASLSDVIVFTADERNNTFGELRVEEITAGQIYRLTVVLDADWLADPKTVYPITIDPSVDYANTTGNIEDLVVGTSTTYSGTSGSLYVGRGASGAKIRTLMRFPNLNISGYNVTSAYVMIRDLICQTTSQDVECYEYVGDSWQESKSIEWTEMGESPLGIFLEKHSVVYGGGNKTISGNAHRYAFNITTLAQMWASGTADPANGVIFKATDDYEANGTKTFKTFASANRSSNQPSLMIQYEPSLILHVNRNYGEYNSILPLYWSATQPEGTTYTWSTSNSSIATVNTTDATYDYVQFTGIGKVDITLTASTGDSATVTVYGTYPDGVYMIQNSTTLKYATLENNRIVESINLLLNINQSELSQYWRVRYLGDGQYSIRSLRKPDMAIAVATTGTDTREVKAYSLDGGTNDANLPARAIWSFSGSRLSSVFQCNVDSTTYHMMAAEGNSYVYASTSTTGYPLWRLIEVTDLDDRVELYHAQTIAGGKTYTLDIGDTMQVSASYYTTGSNYAQTFTWTSSNPAVATVDSTGKVTAVSEGNTTITATSTVNSGCSSHFTVNVRKDAIIIVPGIMGSQLYAAEEFDIGIFTFDEGERLWNPTGTDLLWMNQQIESLEMTSNGISIYPIITNSPTINYCATVQSGFQYGVRDMYRELYFALYDNFYSADCDIVLYEYDWREHPYDTALLLDQFINSQNYGNVSFVAHSMGGLVTSFYLSLGSSRQEKVKLHISVGTPYLGAAKMAKVFIDGNAFDVGLDDMVTHDGIQKIIGNIPSIYALLPYEQYWNKYVYNYITDEQLYTYDDTIECFEEYMPQWNTLMMQNAHELNQLLFIGDDLQHITTTVNSYYIVGTSNNTIDSITCGASIGTDNTFGAVDSHETVAGDGTVTLHSATIGQSVDSDRIYLRLDCSDISGSHTGMISPENDTQATSVNLIIALLAND